MSDIVELFSAGKLKLLNVKAEIVTLNGKEGIRVERGENTDYENYYETLVLVEDSDFKNGVIEAEIAGETAPDAPPESRGFVGVAFRIATDKQSNYECMYIRPENGRADNQLQRNHSVQYIAHPEYPWFRLRKEQPGVYESYVDLMPREWTSIKIVVSGLSAQLYVHGASQPTLIVNDLKHGNRSGQVGFWQHTSTVGYYRNLKITKND